MTNLMTMRQRIKAVQTIQKITHAMRLISMSTHARMKHLQEPVKAYQMHLQEMLATALHMHPTYSHPLLQPTIAPDKNPLIILISAQKGLCGSFNDQLLYLFSNAQYRLGASLITVGKYATQYCQQTDSGDLIASFHNVGLHNFHHIAAQITELISNHSHPFGSITLYGNQAQSFFIQRPAVTAVVPAHINTTQEVKDFYWAQDPEVILTYLSEQYLRVQIQQVLFQSLLAEHAARFISMDTANRNAREILETMQITYNKARQAKITRELTELSAFFIV